MLSIRRILVPVDFSACSREALAQAARIQEVFGAEVDLLHVTNAPRTPAQGRAHVRVPGRGEVTLDELVREEAQRELDEFLADAQTPQVSGLRCEIVASANPYRRILEHAAAGDYDLIVIGTHGLSGFSHLLMGSVAEKVVRHAPCPVLSIRGPAED